MGNSPSQSIVGYPDDAVEAISTTPEVVPESDKLPDTSASSSNSSISDYDEVSESAFSVSMNLNDDQVRETDAVPVEESTECYRLPMFKKKSSALTVLHASESDDEEEYSQWNSCFPSGTTTTTMPPSSDTSDDARTPADKRSRANSYLSFRTCRDNLDDNDDTDFTTGNSDHATGSNADFGCVNSPLGSKHGNSWASFVGREDAKELAYTEDELRLQDGDMPTAESDLQPPRDYWIVTTAALPWMTGTAVNPLLRAGYLSQRNRQLYLQNLHYDSPRSTVTLVLPWLEEAADRLALYGPGWENCTPDDQERFIRNWLCDSANLAEEADRSSGGIVIQWYPARYHAALSSIFAMGDLCELIPEDSGRMICILEEPEHVNFYRAPGRLSWRDKFPHVIGIVHTNYKAYATNHYTGLLTGPLVGVLSALMVRAYCDKVVKLSPVLQTYAPYKEVVSNVHGIRDEFFHVPQRADTKKIYFIGKLLWAKGLDKLLALQTSYKRVTGTYFEMDIIGSGPQQEEIQKAFLGSEYFNPSKASSSSSSSSTSDLLSSADAAARRYWRRFRQPIPARFLGRQDHAAIGANYKIFVNPSITEVLCTTTAEAVAMGKWVLIPKHESNEFFIPFGNCLQYTTRKEFVHLLQYCLTHDPPGWCSGEDDRSATAYEQLTWQAATQRLIDTAYLSKRDSKRCERLQPKDRNIQEWHYALGRGTRGDVLRKVLGAGPVAEQSQYTKSYESSLQSLTSLEQALASPSQ